MAFTHLQRQSDWKTFPATNVSEDSGAHVIRRLVVLDSVI